MFHRVGFRASHDDTIGDDQPDEDRQVLTDGERIGFDELIGDDDQRRNNGHLHDDTDAARGMIAD
jgi:hypothetical protein